MARRGTVTIRVSKEFATLLREIERSHSKNKGFDIGLPKVTKKLSEPPMNKLFNMHLSKKRRRLFEL